jgi:prevent-host-death family protein
MARRWQLQDAKNRLSQVVNEAEGGEPQVITRRGHDAVVIMSIAQFRKLTQGEDDLVSFLRRSPLCGLELESDRAIDPPREVEL